MRVRVLLLGCLIVVSDAGSQPTGVWRTFTAMNNLRSAVQAGPVVWAVGTGGLFSADLVSMKMKTYTVSDGLTSNDLSSVTVHNGSTWVGAVDGSVDVLNPGGSWDHIADIRSTPRVQKRIRTMLAAGDSMLMGTDFGISVYRISKQEFGDTYANFGFTVQAAVNSIMVNGNEIWAATDQGIARAPRFGQNLSSPTSWERFQTAQGLPGTNVRVLILVADTLVAGTSSGAAFFDGTGFQPLPGLSGMQIEDMKSDGGTWYVLTNQASSYSVLMVNGVSGSVQVVDTNKAGTAAALAAGNSGNPGVATTFNGFARWNGSSWDYTIPNGPNSNLFSSLVVDAQGVLWCGSGINGQGRGFYRYNPQAPEGLRWKNFTASQYPILGFNDYHKVHRGIGGSVWVSSWGKGSVQVVDDQIVRKIDTQSTPSFSTTVASDPTFPVVSCAAVDQQGRTWFANWGARSGNFLACLISDSSFAYYNTTLAAGFFTGIAIDEYGTKWLANSEPFHPTKGQYLFYFNEDNIVPGTSVTGGWGYMTASDGLPNEYVQAVAVDRTGSVCVGTELGLMIISDPLYPKVRRFTSFPLREQSVQAIAVDAVNRKWVGTKEGVFVMNADATRILEQYTAATTGGKLVDNDVRSIAIDQERGIAYFGTERGVSSLTIAPVRTERSFSSIEVGPNPYVIPSESVLTIRNLVDDSVIKILRVDGSLVTEFRAQGGGRAFWDGTDRNGAVVGSGVYFLVAYAENGDELATGKVAVIRK